MATNNFKPFATGTGANVLSQVDYEALAALVTGFTSGKASSAQVNKALRQSTFIAASIAQFILNKSAIDVLDDGDLAGFVTDFGNALNKHSQPLDAGLTSLAALAGGANLLPYYTAADVFAQTALTATGRSLIGQTTQANALSYLGGAPLASPGLTGTPTAPTAAAGTNTTQIATTAFIQAVAALLAPLASPALTGTPTVPTADVGTSTTQVASTAFVNNQFANSGINLATTPLVANFDWQQADFITGNILAFQFSATLNPPSGITYNAGTSQTIQTLQVRSTLSVIKMVPLTASPGNRREYTVVISGAKGSRVFYVTQNFNDDSSTTVPITNGGTGAPTAEGAIQNLLVRENLTGIVGATVNAKMTVATASATGTFTADEIIVADSLAGRQFRLTAFSASINLAIQGAGGMDTGTAPVNGFVALYAIYDLGTKKALLAVNATAAAVTEIYGGVNMPSGYTASALLCVVPTDSTGKIAPLLQMGRKTLIATAQLSSTTAFISTPTALNISAAVPKNAKFLDGILYLVSGNSTRPVISVQPLSSPAVGIKQVVGGNSTGVNNTQAPFSDLAISTAQTIYWQVSAGVAGDTISSAFTYATGYSI